jgi:hypothetical protein
MQLINPDFDMSKPLQHAADPPHVRPPASDSLPSRLLTANRALAMSTSLQTSLDPTRLIELFSREAGALITHQGIRYRNEAFDLDVKLGTQARHSCSYRLQRSSICCVRCCTRCAMPCCTRMPCGWHSAIP